MKTTKFKPSEVGPIPEEWEVKALGEVGVFSKGLGVSRSESNSGALPCVRYGEIYTDYNDYIKEFRSFISEKVAAGAKLMSPGDILFAGSGETKEEIGKTVAFLGGVDRAYCGGDILILSPSRGYDSKFLGYVCNSQPIVAQKASRGQGDAVVHIRSGSLAEVVIPVPPRPEQEKIAEALSDVDGLLAAMTKLIKKKHAIKQGAMQQLLTGKKRLAGFTGKWVEKRLGDCGYWIGGGTPSTRISQYWNGSIPWISSSDIVEGDVRKVQYSRFITQEAVKNSATAICPIGTIHIVARVGVGKIAVATRDTCTSQDYTNLVLEKNDVWFFAYLVSRTMMALKEETQGTSIKGLSLEDLKKIVIKVPPFLAEQKAIAAVLTDMDAEIMALEAKLSKYESIKQGMMQELLTGKTRLSV